MLIRKLCDKKRRNPQVVKSAHSYRKFPSDFFEESKSQSTIDHCNSNISMFGKKRSNQSTDRKTINIIDTKGNIISSSYKPHASKHRNHEFHNGASTDRHSKNNVNSYVARRVSQLGKLVGEVTILQHSGINA
jgi:hypothetical protein